MIQSKFNIYSQINDGLLIYNSLHHSQVHIKDEKKLTNYVNGDETVFNQNEIQKLQQLGIVVNEKCDENLLAQKKLGQFIFNNELNLTILPTMQCNFRCRYCYEDFKNSDMNEDDVKAIEQYLYKNLKNYRNLNVEWFGGEPLLNINAIEKISATAINLCRFYHIPYFAVITTNGYLLTAEVMKRLLKAKIYRYQITLDGLEEEHNYNRPLANGVETFKTIVTNLLNIKNEIKSNSFKITIRCNVMRKSIAKLSEHLDFLRKEFGNDDRYEFVIFPVENWGGEKIEGIKNTLLEDKNIIFKTINEYPYTLNINQQFRQFQPFSMCPSLSLNHFVFGPMGKVYKCTLAFDDPLNQIGYIDKDGNLIIDNDKASVWSMHAPLIEASCKERCAMYANCFARKCPYKNLSDSNKCHSNVAKAEENLILAYRFNKNAFAEL